MSHSFGDLAYRNTDYWVIHTYYLNPADFRCHFEEPEVHEAKVNKNV